MLLLVSHYGAVGAAITWLILNLGYVLIVIHVMHKRLLKDEKWRWYFIDVGIPLLASIMTAFMWRIFMPTGMSRYAVFAYLAGVSITTFMSSAILTPYTRFLIGQILIKFNVSHRKSVAEK
jgi:hypothetical protein